LGAAVKSISGGSQVVLVLIRKVSKRGVSGSRTAIIKTLEGRTLVKKSAPKKNIRDSASREGSEDCLGEFHVRNDGIVF